MANIFLEKLEEIKAIVLSQKEILNVHELHLYTHWSKSFIYKNTMLRKIPFYKQDAGAKKLYFKRIEIDAYLTSYKVKTNDELDTEVNNYLIKRKN